MSNILNSFFIEPVVRQARRLSGVPPSREDTRAQLESHARGQDIDLPRQDTAEHNNIRSLAGASITDDEFATGIRSHPIGPEQSFYRRSRSSTTPHQRLSSTTSNQQGNTNSSLSLPLPSAVEDERSSNPFYGIPEHMRPEGAQSSSTSSSPHRRASLSTVVNLTRDRTRARGGSSGASNDSNRITMSGSLPADDGMQLLRRRIHEIREMNASTEEKARRMHHVMTESYSSSYLHAVRPTSPSSIVSQDRPFTPSSTHSVADWETQATSPSSSLFANPENPYNINAGDLVPSYRPKTTKSIETTTEEHEEEESEEHGPALGCSHYSRNVKVQCFDCRRWYPCRHCHDAVEKHSLARRKTENMLCMLCKTPQPASDHCKTCGTSSAWYYCDICKLWDDDSSKKIYHCLECGICRRGEGIGKDFVHCKKCNVCISIGHADSHRCIERATDCDCPICGEYLFNSSTEVASMPCGHYMHKQCYDEYMQVAYKCPFCKKSAVNMELAWRKMTQAIESQPMPAQFTNTKVVIQCNDCSAKSSVQYHWLGNKCNTCDSYNTNEMQLFTDGNEGQAVDVDQATSAGLEELRDQEIVRPSLEVPPRRPALQSTGSYFHSIQPGDRRPSTAAMALDNLRLSPYEMLQRVSRSLSPIRNYLNAPQERASNANAIRVDEEAAEESEYGLDFWTAAGRFLSGDEYDEDDAESEEESSDEENGMKSGHSLEDSDDDDDASGQPLDQLDQIPWHA